MSLGPALAAFRIAGSGRGREPPRGGTTEFYPVLCCFLHSPPPPCCVSSAPCSSFWLQPGHPFPFCCCSQFLLHKSPSPPLEGHPHQCPPGADRVTRCWRWFPTPHLPPGYHAHFTDEKTEAQTGRYQGSDSREPGLAL